MAANRGPRTQQGTYGQWLALVTFVLMPFVVVMLVNTGQFRGLRVPAAVEQAVVGERLATGQGFTTPIVRPRSLAFNPSVDRHPELIHAPLSVVPAAIIAKSGADTEKNGKAFALFSMVAWMFTVYLTWLVGKLVFSSGVGRFAALLVCFSPASLSLAISGDGRAWAMPLLLALWLMLIRAPHGTARAAICGGLLGLLFLTDYGLVLPLLLAVLPALLVVRAPDPVAHEEALSAEGAADLPPLPVRRAADFRSAGIAAAVALILCVPWLVRNAKVTGMPLPGLGTYDIMRNTDALPGRSIERRYTDPGASVVKFFATNTRSAIEKGIGGALEARGGFATSTEWPLTGLLLACLLLPLAPEVRRGAAALVFAMLWDGLLSAMTGQSFVHLVLWVPLTALFAAYTMMHLLEQLVNRPARISFLTWPTEALRRGAMLGLLAFLAVPGLYGQMFTPDWPKSDPSKPNYTLLTDELQDGEAIVTDDPWTVAYHTGQPCVWLPQFSDDLEAIMGLGQVRALYFTRRTGQMFRWVGVDENDQPVREWSDWWDYARLMPQGYLQFQRTVQKVDGEVVLIAPPGAATPAAAPGG